MRYKEYARTIMPEPLKNIYSAEFIHSFCKIINKIDKQFNSKKFTACIFDNEWKNRELKGRMRHIAETLHTHLPKDYSKAITILKKASQKHNGFEYMFLPDYVELYGLDQYQESILALEHFTTYSSSEFAVRPFIQKYNKKMMSQMMKWAKSDNLHHRRLASEGCRPRLPWAMGLPEFKKDPTPVIKILEKLKNDDSEYVRRSVANNLNDISKDNPKLVIQIAKDWKGLNDNTDWVVKHGCRTLLKQGNPKIMSLFGYTKPNHISIEKFKIQKSVNLGDKLEFSFDINTPKKKLGKLRIEYAVDFMKKNGKTSRKVFKISESVFPENNKSVKKYHSFKFITTRKYYTGIHGLAIIINGHELVTGKFKVQD